VRRQYCAEEKIPIVLEGLRDEESIAEHHLTPSSARPKFTRSWDDA
jgi:hypothetical protein